MKLYSYYRSSSAWRVRIVLESKSIAHELSPVSLAPERAEHESPTFGEVNPMHQVPTLEWTEEGRTVRLAQSVAIVEYLEELHPRPALLPRDALSRARVRQAVEIVNSGVQPLQNSSTLASVRRLGGEAAAGSWARAAIERGLASLEASARKHGGLFSVGDELSLADVYLVPQLYNARRWDVGLAPYPALLRIEQRAARLDAFVRAHPDCQPDSPLAGAGRSA